MGIKEGRRKKEERDGKRGQAGNSVGSRRKLEDEEILTMGFWNVAGMKSKCRDERWRKEFEDWVSGKDIVGLVETWMVREEWEEVKGWLPGSLEWTMKGATKRATKGRAKGGIIVGMRKMTKGGRAEVREGGEGLMWGTYQQGKHRINVGVVYVNKN